MRLTKVVIINEADALTRDAQAALRRTMEKYMTNMRLIMCANNTSKIIAPIRSRCLLVRVAAPTDEEVSFAFPSLTSDVEGPTPCGKEGALLIAGYRLQLCHRGVRWEPAQGVACP